MLSAFWLNCVGLLFDTAPYIVFWLLIEVMLHSRSPYYQALSHGQKLWFGLRYALGYLWDKSWYWQIIGVSVFAALALVLPDNMKEMADLTFDASYQPEWYEVASVALLSVLTLVRLLKRIFPNGGGGCDDGHCSVDGRRY